MYSSTEQKVYITTEAKLCWWMEKYISHFSTSSGMESIKNTTYCASHSLFDVIDNQPNFGWKANVCLVTEPYCCQVAWIHLPLKEQIANSKRYTTPIWWSNIVLSIEWESYMIQHQKKEDKTFCDLSQWICMNLRNYGFGRENERNVQKTLMWLHN